jgi:hypothetical protein
VRFRAVDNVGRVSRLGATVRIDRTAPTSRRLAGGSLSWQNVASVT